MSGKKAYKPGEHMSSVDSWQIRHLPKQEANERKEVSQSKKEAMKKKRKQQKKSRRKNR